MTADEALEVARLAALDDLDYARERKASAQQLGISVKALDRMVKMARASLGSGPSHSKPLTVTDLVPWPQTVDGAEILDELVAAFGRHVVMGEPERLIAALWAMHCHVIEATSISPRLAVTSVFPESGKTTVLKVLRYLVPRPMHLIALKGPTLFRTIEHWHPAMLLDECNNWLFAGSEETKGDIISIIDAGHERGVVVPRLVPSPSGKDWVPHGFDVYGPLALALNGKLPEQLDTRSIEIALTRRDRTQPITRLNLRRPPPELPELARKLARWGADHVNLLDEWEAEIPDEVDNRIWDNWDIFFRIAEVIDDEAGGTLSPSYAARTREAALASSRASKANRVQGNPRLQLLADLRDLFVAEWVEDQKRSPGLFDDEASVALFSETIIAKLAELEERPWLEWGRSRQPLSKVQLARLLAPLGIRPITVRRDQAKRKGYQHNQFEKAWRTYL